MHLALGARAADIRILGIPYSSTRYSVYTNPVDARRVLNTRSGKVVPIETQNVSMIRSDARTKLLAADGHVVLATKEVIERRCTYTEET